MQSNNIKKTKIVCTIGPSTWDQEIIKQIIDAGMNCARTNGAFADPNELDRVRTIVRNVSNDVNLMVDVKGPEVRLNKFSEPKLIEKGQEIIIGNSEADEIYPANYKNLYQYLKINQRIIIGDGDVEFQIKQIKDEKLFCEVVMGKILKPGKAMNLPGADYISDTLTQKDKINLEHAKKTGWDSASISFIQNAKSAQYAKDFINDPNIQIIAKIEDQRGLDNIDEILPIVDGIMIARGGLGVELGLECVPHAQRYLIEKSKNFAKPVITATQMLESMNENPVPTRAEVNDVATAILLGTDAIMLSGESASGKYPVEAVKVMSKIAIENEKYIEIQNIVNNINTENDPTSIALARASFEMIKKLNVDKVIVLSQNGFLTRVLSKLNISSPIIGLVQNEKIKNHLAITKNVSAWSFDYNRLGNLHIVSQILDFSKHRSITKPGDKVLVVGDIDVNNDYLPPFFEYILVR